MATEYIVYGQVFRNGTTLPGVTVTAFDQDLPSKRTPRQQLGTPVATDNKGNYRIIYSDEAFQQAERQTADLVLIVTDANQQVLHETKVLFNAGENEQVIIRFNTDDNSGVTEYEKYLRILQPLLAEITIDKLTEKDVAFLARETEISVAHLNYLIYAFKWELSIFKTQVPAEVLYGLLRQQFPVNMSLWVQYTEAQTNAALLRSISQQIIKSFSADDLKRWIALIIKQAVLQSQNESVQEGEAAHGAIIGTVITDNNLQLDFLTRYNKSRENPEQFWQQLAVDPVFQRHVPALQLALKLSVLTNNNLALIKAIQQRQGAQSIEQLVDVDTADWEKLIKDNNVPVPSHIMGEGDERIHNYAVSLLAIMEQNFPNLYVAKVIRQDTSIDPVLKTGVDQFINRAAQFNFKDQAIDAYIKTPEGQSALEGIENKEPVVTQLRRMQRMYNVSGDSETMGKLLQSGMHSAWQIASMPAGQYMQVMSDTLSTQQILATQAKAASITEQVVMSYQEMHDYTMQKLPFALSGYDLADDVIKDIPDYEKLFGALDLCECGHCRSVYSATAYFVSLVHDLLGGKFITSKPSQAKPVNELFKRRPDLKFLKLTCENTETEIPYIDLVNEILETYVAFGQLDEAHTRDSGRFTAEELAANPQFIVEEAYQKIKEAIYPASLPFDLNLETARQYLSYLGSSRYEVMRTFKKEDTPAVVNAMAAEGTGISEKEYALLTQKDLTGSEQTYEPWKLYGYTTATPVLGDALRVRNVKKFLERTGITYADLTSLLTTRFINRYWYLAVWLQDPDIEADPVKKAERDNFINDPANATLLAEINNSTIVLAAPDNAQCDLSKTNLLYRNGNNVSDEAFGNLNRFIRLWKKTGYTARELDLVLTTLSDTPIPKLTPVTIQRTGDALAIAKQVKQPLVNLVCLWGTIDTFGERSLYDKLFLNRAALKIDDQLQLNTLKTALANTSLQINDHIPALLAAFRISESDLQLIRKHAALDAAGAPLSLSTISTLYRYSVLAKSLKLSVTDLMGVLSLAPSIDPFASPADTERFIKLVAKIKASPFRIPQLLYIYRHITPFAKPSYDTVINMARLIREGLTSIDADNSVMAAPALQDIAQKLGKVFDSRLVEQVMGTLDGSFTYQNASEPGVFFNTMLYGFLSPVQVQELLYQQPLPDGNIINTTPQRLQYFADQLMPFLRARLAAGLVKQVISEPLKLEADITELLFTRILPGMETHILDLKAGGLDAFYFNNDDLTNLVLTRIDQQVNFDWGTGTPDNTVSADTFSVRWTGKLYAPSSEVFTFYAGADDGVRLWIDNQLIIDQWASQGLAEHSGTIKLKAGQLYSITMEYCQHTQTASATLKWSSPALPKAIIPAANLFANSLIRSFLQDYLLSAKISMLLAGFDLKANELTYFINNATEFDGFDLSKIPAMEPGVYDELPFKQWQRLCDYTLLRNSLPVTSEYNLLTIFNAASGDFNTLQQTIQQATAWNETVLATLMGTAYGAGFFNAPATFYCNEQFLVTMQHCINLEEKLGISVQKLTAWATVAPDIAQARDIKNTVKARYEDADWLHVAKEVNDSLRVLQRDALVNYLLVQPAIQTLKIEDANDLYQYFLIDVEMDACMITSRIVQANASVQLFVQRCLLNLEPNVAPSLISEEHWAWMKKYRVWEANRKVFLYPENWIEPELRDNKSPFFKELENELLQGEITGEHVQDALMNYLVKLDTVARLDIRGVYDDSTNNTLHVFGRTFNVPYHYYYRRYTKNTKVWGPWEKVQADIEGDHLIPVVWNNRLYLFWPVFTHKAKPQTAGQRLSGGDPQMYYEVKLAWSEYKQHNWTPKMLSTDFLVPSLNPEGLVGFTAIESFTFRTLVGAENRLFIRFFSATYSPNQVPLGEFIFDGCNSSPIVSTKISTYPPVVHLTGTFLRNMAFEEIPNLEQQSNDQLIVFKGNLPATGPDGENYSAAKKDMPVLTSTPGYFQVVASAQNRQFDVNRPFFFQDRNRTYFIEPYTSLNMVITSPIAQGPAMQLPDYELYTPYLPWKDDPNPSDITIGWADPVPYDTIGAPSFDMNTPLNNYIAEGAVTTRSATGNGTLAIDNANAVAVASQYTYGIASTIGKYKFKDLTGQLKLRFHSFWHGYVCSFMKALNKEGVDGLLTMYNQKKGERNSSLNPIADSSTVFNLLYDPKSIVGTPYPHELIDFSETGSYSLYNWELFFHVPMLIANRLSKNQRFEEAMQWYHYIFNPTSVVNESSPKRYWNILEFKKTPKESIQQLLAKLQLPASNPQRKALVDQINQWKDNPFNPHLIARKRLMAYMKNVVMKYLDNLIAWGDHLFRQDSMESVSEATLLYVLAAEILGKKKEKIAPRTKSKAESYNSLRTKLDEFGNALVTMETMFPFYSTATVSNGVYSQVAQLTNMVQSYYFCIPDNDKLLGYWDIVEDRLFKIRHCQNIEGIERKLSLFEPPIDPALLVQAAAQGIDIGSVLNDISAALPHYRFQYILQKANECCNELKGLGNALVSALEKKDAEQLNMIRATQETTLLTLVKEIKKMQYEETVVARENILKTRDTSVQRWRYYKKMLGEESPQEPSIGAAIAEVSLPVDQAVNVDGRKVSSFESQDLSKSKSAASSQSTAGDWEMWSSIGHAVPNFNVEPWGVGTTVGGSNVGSALGAVAKQWQNDAAADIVDATRASKLGSYLRREQDWTLQCNLAAREIMAIDKQLTAAEIRINIAAKERENHDQQIEHSKRIEEFLRNKYTKEELYGWMQGEIATVFFQTYQLTYDLAKKAEKCYRFEKGITSSNFIQFGYWDSFRKGLMSGDRLSLSLKQLEKSYVDQHKREYEVSRHVSLLQFAPEALLQLKGTGSCEVLLPEILFDKDYPGHYMRRIKTVSLTIPCVVGPYTNVNCTLTLLSSEVRTDNTGEYEKQEEDTRFLSYYGSLQSIATSHAQNDSGLFELNFRDERYLPFEGYGAVSRWRIDMPQENNQFDFNSMADLILHIKYTARDGGEALRIRVNDYLAQEVPAVGTRLLSLKHDFPNEWHQFITQSDEGIMQSFEAILSDKHFPYPFRGQLDDMEFSDLQLVVIPAHGINLSPSHATFGNVAVTSQVQIQEATIIIDESAISSLAQAIRKNGMNRLDQKKISDVLLLLDFNG